MARVRAVFRCTECGAATPKWAGRCPSCEAWNTLVEEVEAPADRRAPSSLEGPRVRPVPIVEVELDEWEARATGIGELDRVLGGGLVPGSVTLVGGEPGIGKSTLLLQAVSSIAADGARVLYVSGEESTQQVRHRAERLGALRPSLWLAAETSLPHVVASLDEVAPDVVVVDSIQTLYDPELGSAPGSVVQVRECAARLVTEAKARGLATVLVGHVTKEGGLAGPRVLEHVVDTVLAFEGERHHALRLLRASKHRFGATDQLGLFEMTDGGLVRRRRPQPAVPRRPPARRLGHRRGPHHGRPPARCWSSCRPWWRPPGCPRPAGRPRGSTAAASRCCWPCCASGRASPSPSATSTPSPWGACG